MSHLPVLFAEVSEFADTVSVERNVLTSGLSQLSIILLALLAVILIAFIGVLVFRKQLLRRKRRHHHHRKSSSVVPGQNGHDSAPPSEIKISKKRRRVRRKHRHLNPTLAETRGLPPNRDEQSMAPPLS
jgi:ABC-type nickel/cobalt efflux system permease component RcnA